MTAVGRASGPVIGHRWGVRPIEIQEYRRLARIASSIYLVAAVASTVQWLEWRKGFAHPGYDAAFIVQEAIFGTALLILALTLPDHLVRSVFPPAAPLLLSLGVVTVAVAAWAQGFAQFGMDVVLYDVLVVLGFYILRRREAIALLVLVAVVHGVLVAVSPGVAAPFAQWFYLMSTLAITGLMIGTAMSKLDQSRHELAELNRDLEATVTEQVDEIRQSRARIVAASDAGRRRIERNIHDGAQQQLVAISLDLRMVAEEADRLDRDELRCRLDDVHGNLRAALHDLRELARGLHPAVLATDGLEAALGQLATRCPIPVSLVVPARRFPATVELAAYFVVAEAVANVVKYAGASAIEIEVDQDDGALRLGVADDGQGGAVVKDGGGLAGLVDRVAALGGNMGIVSPQGAGTTVYARLPLRGADAAAVVSGLP
jgi:signal transduction histidine kinase